MQKTQISKKTYFISLIALVFVLGLSGCGKPQEDVVMGEGMANEDIIVEGENNEDLVEKIIWSDFEIIIPKGFRLESENAETLFLSNVPLEEWERVDKVNEQLIKEDAGRSGETFRLGSTIMLEEIVVSNSLEQTIQDHIASRAALHGNVLTPRSFITPPGNAVTVYKNISVYLGEHLADFAYVEISTSQNQRLIHIKLEYPDIANKAQKQFEQIINSIRMKGSDIFTAFWNKWSYNDYSFNDQELIQQLLEKHPGPLKSYSETHIYDFGDEKLEQEISGDFILWDACFDVDQEINCKILLTLLELKTGALTDEKITIEEINDSFPDLYDNLNEDLYDKLFSWAGLLHRLEQEYYQSKNLAVKLKDGQSIKLPTDIDLGSYVVKHALGRLALNQGEWDRWTCLGDDSFVSVFNKLFYFSSD